jgi:glyoxylase-like metal-dependent hydrolase (beta-lactamase superfamily II)
MFINIKKIHNIFMFGVIKIRAYLIVFIFFFFAFCDSAFPQNECIKYIKKTRVSDKLLIVGIGDAVSALLTQKGIVVFDAGESPTITGFYRKMIENEFHNKNFAFLINTHSHMDHTNGNSVFSDLTMISHKNCPPEITGYWKDPERIRKIYQKTLGQCYDRLKSSSLDSADRQDIMAKICRYKYSHDDIKEDQKPTLPAVTFSDTMSLDMGDMTLEIYYFGIAHTNNDILIYIPQEKLLFTGDLFVKGGNPSFKKQDLKSNKYSYDVLKYLITKDNIQTLITGHGNILRKEDLASFFEEIKSGLKQLK